MSGSRPAFARATRSAIHYDPMLAKLIVWDQDRAGALRRLRNALESYQVVGVTTNLELLAAIAAHPAFAAGELDTRLHRAPWGRAFFPHSDPPRIRCWRSAR